MFTNTVTPSEGKIHREWAAAACFASGHVRSFHRCGTHRFQVVVVKLPVIIYPPLHKCNLSTFPVLLCRVFCPPKNLHFCFVDLAQVFTSEETNCGPPDNSFVCDCINPH